MRSSRSQSSAFQSTCSKNHDYRFQAAFECWSLVAYSVECCQVQVIVAKSCVVVAVEIVVDLDFESNFPSANNLVKLSCQHPSLMELKYSLLPCYYEDHCYLGC